MTGLLGWVLAASSLLAPARSHDVLAEAIATRVEAEAPLFKNDDDRRRTAAFLVAIAFRESSLVATASGDSRGGKPTSFCAFQLHLPWGAKTAEGWTGEDLLADPDKCVTAAMHMLRTSVRACPAHPLAWYAEGPAGCESPRAQRISRDRMAIAQRLVRDVRVPDADGDAPALTLAPPKTSVGGGTGVANDPVPARPGRFCGGA